MPVLATLPGKTGPSGHVTDAVLPELSAFAAAYPGYRDTVALDELRAAEYWYLDAGGHVYMDYTGSGLP